MGGQLNGTTGADALRVAAGAGDLIVQGGGGADVLTVDWSNKTQAITSYSAYGFHSHGPAWLDAGDGDKVSYGEIASGLNYAQLNKLVLWAGSGSDTLWGGAVTNEIHAGAGYDHIYGGVGSDALYGDAGDDTIYGDGGYHLGGGNDQLFGGAGADTLIGEAGDDRIDGGLGVDTAVYSGAHTDYSIRVDRTGAVILQDLRGTDGTDTLTRVERVQFSDGVYDLVRGHLVAEDQVGNTISALDASGAGHALVHALMAAILGQPHGELGLLGVGMAHPGDHFFGG